MTYIYTKNFINGYIRKVYKNFIQRVYHNKKFINNYIKSICIDNNNHIYINYMLSYSIELILLYQKYTIKESL